MDPRPRRSVLPLLLLPWVLVGCEPDPAAPEELTSEDRDAIQAIADVYASFVVTGEPVRIAELYLSDGAAIPPDRPVVQGQADLVQWLTDMEGVFTRPEFSVAPVEIGGNRDLAYAWQSFRYTTQVETNDQELNWEDEGDWILLLRRSEEGIWAIHRDIWNRSHPAARP